MNLETEPTVTDEGKIYTVRVCGHFEYEVTLAGYSAEAAKEVAKMRRRDSAIVFDSVEIVAEREIGRKGEE